jgi:hypothetical protein
VFVQGLEGPETKMQNISLRLSQITFPGVLRINLHAFSDVVPPQKLTAVADPTFLQWPMHIKKLSGFLQVTILPMVCFDILNVCHSTMLSRGRSPS